MLNGKKQQGISQQRVKTVKAKNNKLLQMMKCLKDDVTQDIKTITMFPFMEIREI